MQESLDGMLKEYMELENPLYEPPPLHSPWWAVFERLRFRDTMQRVSNPPFIEPHGAKLNEGYGTEHHFAYAWRREFAMTFMMP